MIENNEIMIEHAIELMQILGIDKETQDSFRKGIVKMSLNGEKPQDLTDKVNKLIKEYETHEDRLVYHVIAGELPNVGLCVNLLYVSTYEEDYDICRVQAERNQALSYVYNLSIPEFSESGFIQVMKAPYLVRIG